MNIRNNVVAYVAILVAVVLAPTSAYAASLMVRSGDIVDGQVKSVDLGSNSVRSGKIADGQVTGADVVESSLGQVPTALQGGLGRHGTTGSCDPETLTYVPCSTVSVTLAAPARLLVIGSVRAASEVGADEYQGNCRIGTTSGAVNASTDYVQSHDGGVGEGDYSENLTVMAVTTVFPVGTHVVGVDCNQTDDGAIVYEQARVVVVALSAG